MKFAALDIGGTTIKYGVINDSGTIVFKSKRNTDAQKGVSNLLSTIKVIIKELKKNYKLEGIAISSAGQICPKTGKVLYATDNLPGYTGTPLKDILEKEFTLPVCVVNDVNAAALGELWKGAGKGYNDFLVITVGTGIGGAIINNGELYYGNNGIAAEFGHIKIEPKGRKCTCGGRGCWEQYSSTKALIQYAKERYEKANQNVNQIDGKWLFDQANKGDSIAEHSIEQFIYYLSLGLSSLIYIFNPKLIIIGGAITGQGTRLCSKIENNVKQLLMESFAKDLKIKFAECGNNAGLLGAIYELKRRHNYE